MKKIVGNSSVTFVIGVFLMAIAVGNILEPKHLVTGGAAGLAIIIETLSANAFSRLKLTQEVLKNGIPLWITTLVLNVPLFMLAAKKKGKEFLRKSLVGTVLLSFFLAIVPKVVQLPDDLLLNALLGGVVEGVGLGLVLRAKGSTGGSDLLATLLHKMYPQYSISRIMALIDGCIIALGLAVFGILHGGYSLITVYLLAYISDLVANGFGKSVMIQIISNHAEEIANELLHTVERGVTAIPVTGLYHRKKREMLLCVVAKKQVVYVKEIVYRHDKNAFVMLTDTRETLGEGFNKMGNNIL